MPRIIGHTGYGLPIYSATTTPKDEIAMTPAATLDATAVAEFTASIRNTVTGAFALPVTGPRYLRSAADALSVIENVREAKRSLIALESAPWERMAGHALAELSATLDAATTADEFDAARILTFYVSAATDSADAATDSGISWRINHYSYSEAEAAQTSFYIHNLIPNALIADHVIAAFRRITGVEMIHSPRDYPHYRATVAFPGMPASEIRSDYSDAMGAAFQLLGEWKAAQRAATERRERRRRTLLADKAKRMGPAPIKRHDSSENFRTWLSKRATLLTPATPAEFAALPLPAFAAPYVTPMPRTDPYDADYYAPAENPSTSRTWGIEIEHVDSDGIGAPYSSDANESWDAKDDCSLVSYNGNGYSECECQGEFTTYLNGDYRDVQCGELGFECGCCSGDCDCESDNSDGCQEFVSPILSHFFDDGLTDLTTALAGRGSNDSAGVHVHVGASDYHDNKAAQARLAYGWALVQGIIRPVLQREKEQYARPVSARDVLEVVRAEKGRNSNGYAYLDRYLYVNIHAALSSHGTIEFRAMGPVYDEPTLIRWAHLCRRFVEFTAKNVDSVERLRSVTDLRSLTSVIGWEEN